MICKVCGEEISEGTKFCLKCGAPVEAEQTQGTVYQPERQYQPIPALNDTPILVFGILSLAFGTILGIIFGSIGKKKANEFFAQNGFLTGKAKAGRILSKVGFILGIVSTIAYAIYFTVIIAGIASGAYRYF